MTHAEDAAKRTSRRLYGDCGHNCLADHAEDQLQGRSHYYDANTRRGFGSRVNHLETALGGLLLCTVESVSPPGSKRQHRAVVHDLRGNVIYRSCDNDDNERYGYSRGDRAYKDLREWLESYHDEETEAARVVQEETAALRRSLDRAMAKPK